MESNGSQGLVDRDDGVYIPLTTMSARIVGNNALVGISINNVLVKSWNPENLIAAQFQITNLLRIRHNIYPPQADGFRITNQADVIKAFSNIVGLLIV